MIYPLLRLFTDSGDSAVTLAFTLVTALFFAFSRQKKAAWAILAAFTGAAVLDGAAKVVLYSCGFLHGAFDLRSPSGHSAISIAVYGVFALIVSSTLTDGKRFLPFLIVIPVLALITLSRVILGYHTPSDVIVGAVIGVAVVVAVGKFVLKDYQAECRWEWLAGFAVAGFAVTYGHHFPAEQMIHWIAENLREQVHMCLS